MMIKQFCILTALTLFAYSYAQAADGQLAADLVGTWQCGLNQDQGVTKLTVNTQETFHADGTASSVGTMMINVPQAGVSASYTVKSTSLWRVQGNRLINTTTDIDVTDMTNPKLDELLRMEDALKAQPVEASSFIEQLDANILTLKGVGTHTTMRCTR